MALRPPWSTSVAPDLHQNKSATAVQTPISLAVQSTTMQSKPNAAAYQSLMRLPKGDLLRRLAEKLEIKNKEVSKALHTYDELDRVEFKTFLNSFGMDLTDDEYQQLLRCVPFECNFFELTLKRTEGESTLMVRELST